MASSLFDLFWSFGLIFSTKLAQRIVCSRSHGHAAVRPAGGLIYEAPNGSSRELLVLEEVDRVEQLGEIVNNIVGFDALFFLRALV